MAEFPAERCYEVVVVGAGIQGSATAYYLTQKLGIKNVLLLEQFSAQHSRGSSYGGSRLIKRAYAQPIYVKMMEEAFQMWDTLEAESQNQLYIKTGVLLFGPQNTQSIVDVKETLRVNANIPHQIFSGKKANEKYCKQLSLPDDFTCVLDEDGGILRAAKAIQAYQTLFMEAGGVLKDEHPVTEIIPGETVTVRTSKGSFQTRRLVITVGPWAPKLLQSLRVELPYEVLRVESLYWTVQEPEDFSSENFPTFIGYNSDDKLHFYGSPVYEYPGLIKVCYHNGIEVDPDQRDLGLPFNTVKLTSDFVSKFFKGVSTSPSIMEPCMITRSRDYHPALDCLPDYPNIVIGAGFSGHGFKLSPVIGKILSELCLDLSPSYDLSIFKITK